MWWEGRQSPVRYSKLPRLKRGVSCSQLFFAKSQFYCDKASSGLSGLCARKAAARWPACRLLFVYNHTCLPGLAAEGIVHCAR